VVMNPWEPKLLSRLGWGLRLFRRTLVLQFVVGAAAVAASLAVSAAAGWSVSVGVMLATLSNLMLWPWVSTTMMAGVAAGLRSGGMPDVRESLAAGSGRLPVMGLAVLALSVLAIGLGIPLAWLAGVHWIAVLLLFLLAIVVGLRLFILPAVVTMEDVGPVAAIRRSWQLSQGMLPRLLGNGAALLVVFLALTLLVFGLAWLIGLSDWSSRMATASAEAGGTGGPLGLLLAMGESAWMAILTLVVGWLALNALFFVLLHAYAFFFYVEARQAHEGGVPDVRPAPAAGRRQWTVFLAVILGIAMLPAAGVALDLAPPHPAPSGQGRHSPAGGGPPRVRAVPPRHVSKATGKVDRGDEAIPDAMKHMVRAPEVDIERLRDPFASYLATVARRAKEALARRSARMANRPHEPLEDFDLSTLKLVAILRMGEQRVAMVEDAEGKGYVVRRGNYMGKNNGRVVRITDESVFLVEQVVNPAGDLVSREVELTLKETHQ